MPVQFTTDLPSAEGLDLDGSEPDEITAQWTDTINNGEYRMEVQEADGDEAWGDSGSTVVGQDVLEHTFSDILDGEKYNVRIRTQTEHVTGDWLEANNITNLPAPDGIGFTTIGTTSLEVQWTDNADFEGSYQIYRRRTDYDYDGGDGRLVGTVGQNTESFVDDTVSPDRKYDYFVRARTDWVYADTTSGAVTTDTIGLEDRAVPPRGWYAELETPSGTVRTVPIADGAQWRPRLNGLPRVSLPVPKNDVWRDLEGQPLRVWYHGNRLPIDELEAVTTEEGQTILEGRGGLQLQKNVNVEYSSKAAHEAVAELIQTETDYAANVDAPDPEPMRDEPMLSADTTGEFQDALETVTSEMPFEPANGESPVLQTAVLTRGAARDSSSNIAFVDGDKYIEGQALLFGGSSGFAEWDLSFAYDIPPERVGIAVHDETLSDSKAKWFFNGTEIDENNFTDGPLSWWDIGSGDYGGSGYDGSIQAGETYTLKVDIQSSSEYVIDAICVFDKAYYPAISDWDDEGWDTVHEPAGHLNGPPLHPPDGAQIQTNDIETPYSVIAARLDSVWNDTSAPQKLEVSNDQGDTWLEASNAQTLDQDFPADGGTLRARFTLGGYGTRDDATPRKGYQPQSIHSFDLFADLADTPVLVNQTYEGDLIEVITEIANYADAISEVRRDDGYSIEWTRAGQRTSERSLDVTSYSDRKTIEGKTLACEVVGGRQTVSGELFTPEDTTAISLANGDLISGTEFVYDPETSTSYERGRDYAIGNNDGTIRITDSGSMSTGTTYAIDYEFKPRGRFEDDAWDGDATVERTVSIPSLTTRRGCQQAALRVVQETSTPLNEVEINFADIDPDQPLVEAINLDLLPGDEYYETREIDFENGRGRGVFADRESYDEVVQGIRSRIDAVARRS